MNSVLISKQSSKRIVDIQLYEKSFDDYNFFIAKFTVKKVDYNKWKQENSFDHEVIC